MSNNNNKTAPIVITALTAAAVAGVAAYAYFNKDDESSPWNTLMDFISGISSDKSAASGNQHSSNDPTSLSEQEVIGILRKISNIQHKTKNFLRDLIQELSMNPKPLVEVYEFVKKETPEDPLSSSGISTPEFDELLTKYEASDEVKALIDQIMGNESLTPSGARDLPIQKIIEVHQFMNAKLRDIVSQAKKLSSSSGSNYESRWMTLAGQAMVGAQVLSQFQVEPSEVEAAMLLNYGDLQHSQEFLQVSVQMQALMSELMSINE